MQPQNELSQKNSRNKMLQPYKPDSVTSHRKAFYHLSSPAVTHRIQLPTPSGKLLRATREIQIDLPEYIWHFNSQGLPPKYITVFQRVLLPHVFTLISPSGRDGFFSVALFCPSSIFRKKGDEDPPVRWCDALRCPDFPLFHPVEWNSDRTDCSILFIYCRFLLYIYIKNQPLDIRRIHLLSGVLTILLFGMALWNSMSKYTQYDKNKKTEIVQKNIRSIYSQIKELSAHENLQNLLAEQNQDKSSEIRTLLHHQYPFTKKSSLYLWNDHDLQYWDTHEYELYFEHPPINDTIQLLYQEDVPFIKFTLLSPSPDLSVFLIATMEEILHQNPHHISSSSLIPSIPDLEEAIQLNRFENKTTTAFIFYIAGLLTLLFFIFLLAYRNLGRYPNYQVFSVLIILLITLRTTAYFFPLENSLLSTFFQPQFLHLSGSIADLFINILILFIFGIFFYRHALFPVSEVSLKEQLILSGMGYLVFSLQCVGFSIFVYALIHNPYIPLDIDVIEHLSVNTLLLLIATFILLLSLFTISIRIFISIQKFKLAWNHKIGLFLGAVLISSLFLYFSGLAINFWLWVISLSIIMLLFDLFLDSSMHDFTWISVWILILSLFSTVLFYHFYRFKLAEDSTAALRQTIELPDSTMIKIIHTIHEPSHPAALSSQVYQSKINDILFQHPEIEKTYQFDLIHSPAGSGRQVNTSDFHYDDQWPGTYLFDLPLEHESMQISVRSINNTITYRGGPNPESQQTLFRTGDWTHYHKGKNMSNESLFFPPHLDSLSDEDIPVEQIFRNNTVYTIVRSGDYAAVGRQEFDGLLQPLSFFSFNFILALIVLGGLVLLHQFFPFLPEELHGYFIENITLRNKIQFSVLAILISAFTIVGIVSANFYKRSYKETLESTVKEYYHRIKRENIQNDKTIQTLQGLPGNFIFYDKTGKMVHPIHSSEAKRLPYPTVRKVLTSASLDSFDEILPGSLVVPISMDPEDTVFLTYPHTDQVPEGFYRFLNLLLNAFVFLLLISSALSFSISNSIISPLIELGKKLKEFSLGKRNEPIALTAADELGTLIQAYNDMVTKLEQSAELLAHTEREVAWREMAKQVAHEIKNPLTPMKLSIQHMEMRIKEADEDTAKEIVEDVSRILIEQIDNLSRIASEFSSFAKLPKPEYEQILLNDLVASVYDLFRTRSRIHFNLYVPIDELIVQADRTHLIRVMNNLVKNAVQSIPEDREGHIVIRLRDHNGHAIVMVEDNGKGIEEDLYGKVFFPNFTTKSSGTGLGLAISKNIIETFGGTIYFTRNKPQGTIFIFELPLVNE